MIGISGTKFCRYVRRFLDDYQRISLG